jgi:RimJ/RimL family protein N-acetyltransferase
VRTEESGTRTVTIRGVAEDEPRPSSASAWDDWGETDPAAFDMPHERWIIEVTENEATTVVGDMSAHSVWYGPTPGSRALSIGISLVEEHRGRGIGAEQRSLDRAGFDLEGVLRGAQVRRDGRHDLQMWSHVREGA